MEDKESEESNRPQENEIVSLIISGAASYTEILNETPSPYPRYVLDGWETWLREEMNDLERELSGNSFRNASNMLVTAGQSSFNNFEPIEILGSSGQSSYGEVQHDLQFLGGCHSDCDINISNPLFPELAVSHFRSQKISNALVKMSLNLRSPNPDELKCKDCFKIPESPVTGQCGHTRCFSCILENSTCSCGVAHSFTKISVNTEIQSLTEKMNYSRNLRTYQTSHAECANFGARKNALTGASIRSVPRRGLRGNAASRITSTETSGSFSRLRIPMNTQARFKKAQALLVSGNLVESGANLARVAASGAPAKRVARKLLTQTVKAMCQTEKTGIVAKKLSRCIREQSASSWIQPQDLKCILCLDNFRDPVTIPCGHTYCRSCITKGMTFRDTCALCMSKLDFDPTEIGNNVFLNAILNSVEIPPTEGDLIIPIVTCSLAFPRISCPLFIHDTQFWHILKELLDNGVRNIGIVAHDKEEKSANYGTGSLPIIAKWKPYRIIFGMFLKHSQFAKKPFDRLTLNLAHILTICDCVLFEDNRCILSTVGICRFRILGRYKNNGYNIARITTLHDLLPKYISLWEIRLLGRRVYKTTIKWISRMEKEKLHVITTAFGSIPLYSETYMWWNTRDGPDWLWWLLAILPVDVKIKMMIFSTTNLPKRMLAVERVLQLMEAEHFKFDMSSDNISKECHIENFTA